MIDLKELARQLRLPEGENAAYVTDFMATGNSSLYDCAFTHLHLFPEAKVLEIGPANGFFVGRLFKNNEDIQYTGMDLSRDMIKAAEQLNASLVESGKAKFVSGDVVDLPFEDNSFDRIFTVNTLYFWSDPQRGMAELRRVLRPGGTLIIAIRSKETMMNMPFTEFGFQLYTKQNLDDLYKESGFGKYHLHSYEEDVTLPSGAIVHMESFCAIGEKS